MKRFSKMLALGLAAVLVFGMSAQAAPSVNTSNSQVGQLEGERTDVEVKAVENTAAISTALVTEEALKALGTEYAEGTKKVEVAGSFDLKIVEDSAKGSEVTVAVAGVKAANDYKLFHFTDDFSRIIEVITPVVADGKITFKLGDSASPFVLVDMGQKASTPSATTPPSGGGSSNESPATSPAVAPKTGETVPVAGIMALVLMAGAVFCAKKARYNR